MKKKERATKHLKIYPSSHDKLRALAYKKRISMAAAFATLVRSAS